MIITLDRIALRSHEPIQLIDLTAEVRAILVQRGLRDGLMTVFSAHTTACIAVNEDEERLRGDILAFLGRLAPARAGYGHDLAPVDARENAHAHLIGLLMNTSVSLPVQDGQLQIGGWQTLFFVELDGPRAHREVGVHLMGRG